MADLTINEVKRAGLAVSLTAVASGGDAMSNTGAIKGRVFCIFSNAHSSASRTITAVTQETRDSELSLAVADATVTLTAGQRKIVGPFPSGIYNDANGKVQFTYSDSGADIYAMAAKCVPATG